jgi:hypothetical protein
MRLAKEVMVTVTGTVVLLLAAMVLAPFCTVTVVVLASCD